ncbi:methyltransferase (plasmid) [Bradyrhizobium guangxiense]
MQDKAPTSEPASQMLLLLNACLTTQALHAAARLGIADELIDGPREIGDISAVLGAQPDALERLMRMLASIGVLRAGEGRTYQLTPLGETLRSDGPNSVRDWALYIGALAPWNAWGHLYESVKTGTPGFVLAHGMPTYDFLESHPELAACFNRWMSKQSAQQNAAIVDAYDFSKFKIKRVLMICGDAEAVRVLRNCRAHLRSSGKVLVVEMVMSPVGEPGPAATFDILMLLANKGGRIRTESEFRELFAEAGLKLDRVISTRSPNVLLEGTLA